MSPRLGKPLLIVAACAIALLWLSACYLPDVWKDLRVPFYVFLILTGVFLFLGFVAGAAARAGIVRYRLAFLLIFAPAIHGAACGIPWPWAHVFLAAPSAAILIAVTLESRS